MGADDDGRNDTGRSYSTSSAHNRPRPTMSTATSITIPTQSRDSVKTLEVELLSSDEDEDDEPVVFVKEEIVIKNEEDDEDIKFVDAFVIRSQPARKHRTNSSSESVVSSSQDDVMDLPPVQEKIDKKRARMKRRRQRIAENNRKLALAFAGNKVTSSTATATTSSTHSANANVIPVPSVTEKECTTLTTPPISTGPPPPPTREELIELERRILAEFLAMNSEEPSVEGGSTNGTVGVEVDEEPEIQHSSGSASTSSSIILETGVSGVTITTDNPLPTQPQLTSTPESTPTLVTAPTASFQTLAFTINTGAVGDEAVNMSLALGDNPQPLFNLRIDKGRDQRIAPPPPKINPSESCQTGPSVFNGEVESRPSVDLTVPKTRKISEFCQTGESLFNGEEMTRPFVDVSTPRNLKHQRRRRSRSRSLSPPPKKKSNHRKDRSNLHSGLRDMETPLLRENRESSVISTVSTATEVFTDAKDLLKIIKSCEKCGDTFASRKDAVRHQKKKHKRKHCPVCFKLYSTKKNAWKDHLNQRHATDEDSEQVQCPLCKHVTSFEGMYTHISVKHFVAEENRETEELRRVRDSQNLRIARAAVASATATRQRAPSSPPAENDSDSDDEDEASPPPLQPAEPISRIRISGLRQPIAIPTVTPPLRPPPPRTQPTIPNTRPVMAPPNPPAARKVTCYTPRAPIPTSQRMSSAAGPSRLSMPPPPTPRQVPNNYKTVLDPVDKAKLRIEYNRNPTPDARDLARMSTTHGVDVGVIKAWFSKTYRWHCEQKSKKKKS